MKAVIWDLDGVLANNSEELYTFITQHERAGVPIDWDIWNRQLGGHEPRSEYVALARLLKEAGHVNIVLSARPQRIWQETVNWLDTFMAGAWDVLALRDESRPFHLCKQDHVERLITQYQCVLAFDNEECWVELYRAFGIPSIHVVDGFTTLALEEAQLPARV